MRIFINKPASHRAGWGNREAIPMEKNESLIKKVQRLCRQCAITLLVPVIITTLGGYYVQITF